MTNILGTRLEYDSHELQYSIIKMLDADFFRSSAASLVFRPWACFVMKTVRVKLFFNKGNIPDRRSDKPIKYLNNLSMYTFQPDAPQGGIITSKLVALRRGVRISPNLNEDLKAPPNVLFSSDALVAEAPRLPQSIDADSF
ncbi:hypothetical protein ACU8KH_06090 [Lachancea thermotolerans]